MRTIALAAACCLALAALSACAVHRTPLGNPESPYPPARPPQVGEIIHLPTGTTVTEEQMLAAVTDARIAYVGETHDNLAAHRLQLAVLKAMADRWPGQVSLGMEMFTRAQQPVLDRWVAGELTEKEFLKQSDWYTVWTMDFTLYRDLLVFARERGIPVVGLNADKELVRAISRNAPDEVASAQRQELPEMDLGDPYQTAMVAAIYGGHTAGANHLAGFQRVQTLWDETMAESVARHLQSFPDPGRRMVVLAGGHHIRYGFGIPRRVFRRLPTSYVLVGSQEIEIPKDANIQRMEVDLPLFPMAPYDFVAFTRYEQLPGDQVKLGVRMEEQGGKVVVKAVVPGSTADVAGVHSEDVIIGLGQESITESFDLVYAVGQYKKGDRATLVVERGGETLQLELDFQPLPEHGARKP